MPSIKSLNLIYSISQERARSNSCFVFFIGIPLAGIYSTPEKKNDIFLID